MSAITVLISKAEVGAERWNADFNDERIVDSARDPEHQACRTLHARGISGRVQFFHTATGAPGLSIDIATGAGLSVQESDTRSPHIEKFKPFSAAVESPARVSGSKGIEVPEKIGGTL